MLTIKAHSQKWLLSKKENFCALKDTEYSCLELSWEQEKMALGWKQAPSTDFKWLATFNSAHICSDKSSWGPIKLAKIPASYLKETWISTSPFLLPVFMKTLSKNLLHQSLIEGKCRIKGRCLKPTPFSLATVEPLKGSARLKSSQLLLRTFHIL